MQRKILVMAANPMWVAGMKPTNPAGKRGSVFTAKGRLEAIIQKRYTVKHVIRILDALPPKDQLDFYKEMQVLLIARPSQDGISGAEVEKLMERVQESLTQKKHG